MLSKSLLTPLTPVHTVNTAGKKSEKQLLTHEPLRSSVPEFGTSEVRDTGLCVLRDTGLCVLCVLPVDVVLCATDVLKSFKWLLMVFQGLGWFRLTESMAVAKLQNPSASPPDHLKCLKSKVNWIHTYIYIYNSIYIYISDIYIYTLWDFYFVNTAYQRLLSLRRCIENHWKLWEWCPGRSTQSGLSPKLRLSSFPPRINGLNDTEMISFTGRRGTGCCGTTTSCQIQGLLNVPFWVYWTSPYSSHYRLYT